MSAREALALERLASLNAKQARLLRELGQALSIQEHYPQAFAHGPCSIRWTRRGGDVARCTLTDGAGNEYEVPATLAAELRPGPRFWQHARPEPIPSLDDERGEVKP